MNKGSIIIQEDFADNYTLKQKNEVMAAHWAPEQVTVFTGVVFYRSNDESCLQMESFARHIYNVKRRTTNSVS